MITSLWEVPDEAKAVENPVEATDEASHEGKVEEKIKALEQIDEQIVGPLHEHLRSQGDYRLLLSPDPPTFLRTKTHSHGNVPITACGRGLDADSAETYDDVTAAASSLVFEKVPFRFME